MNSKRHDRKSSSPLISSSLDTIFIETVHEIQFMFGDLLDFISDFHHEKLRKQCIIHEKNMS